MTSKYKTNTRTEILDYLYSAQLSATQCQTDILLANDQRVVYNLDYSAFFCGIWPNATRNNLYDAVSGEFCDKIINAEKLPFTPVITSVTFLEILESFWSVVERKKDRAANLSEKVLRIRQNIETLRAMPGGYSDGIPLQNEHIRNELGILNDSVGTTLKRTVQNASRLLGHEGSIVGLGTIIPPSLRNIHFDQAEFDSLFDKMWDYRTKRDKAMDADEREFRYSVDAINIYITQKLNQHSNSTEYNYVSKASYTSEFCPENGRTPLVPLFWLNAEESEEFLSSFERSEFFKNLAINADYVRGRFVPRPELPNEKDFNFDLLENFNKLYMRQLSIIKDHDIDLESEYHERLFTDRNFARDLLDQNISEAEATFARLFNDFGGVYTDDLVERGGIERLKYFQELTQKLEKLATAKH